MATNKTGGRKRREQLRLHFWPDEDAWTGENEKGWFLALRTLPLVLGLLSSKALSGNCDPTRVYLELLARHFDNGVVEMTNEKEHAYAAGFSGNRAVRTWRERMKVLEKNGFIRTERIGNQDYKYVLLVHPTTAVQHLRDTKKVDDNWWKAYCARKIETKEASYEDRKKTQSTNKVVTIKPSKTATHK